jgi:hypothetical protein
MIRRFPVAIAGTILVLSPTRETPAQAELRPRTRRGRIRVPLYPAYRHLRGSDLQLDRRWESFRRE